MIDLQKQKEERISLASAQQRQAADPRVSVWVEASAGTGKTKVLSDRVLRILLNGASPSRLLCLTYTKAAAVEMSNRIAERLSRWAVEKDEKLVKELENLTGKTAKDILGNNDILARARKLFAILLDTPGGMKIQTIHSFCQDILKRFPLEANISPYFEVMDDRTAREAIELIKKEMLNSSKEKEIEKAIAFLTANAGEYKFPLIMQSVTEKRNLIEEYLQKYANIEDAICAVAENLGVERNVTEKDVEEVFWESVESNKVELLVKAMADGSDKTAQKSVKLAEAFNGKIFDACVEVLLTEGRPRKDLLVKKSKEKYPEVELILNELMKSLAESLNKMKDVRLLNSTEAVLIFADKMLGKYREYKKKHSKMDYNDLIMLTKKLLETPKVADWILYKLDGGIDDILIDEAQDTSPEQWSIVKSLTEEFFSGAGNHSRKPTVFVVGDRKQSIYSFQGADPAEFERMYKYFAKTAGNFKNVNMEVSFRSTSAVLDVVNQVFAYDKAKKGVVKEGQNIAHIPSRIGDGGCVEFWPLIEPEENDNNDKVWLPPVERVGVVSPSAKLAKQIAESIKIKVANKEILKSKNRPVKYSDFLILVQRRNVFVEEMVRACKNAGVSITGVDKIKLQEQIVVNDLVALAKFTLLPDDDLNLACVLKSPLFSLDDDDLFTLCYNRGEKSVWQRMRENEKYLKQVEVLSDLYNLVSEVRIYEFFAYVLSKLNGRRLFVERLGPDCEDALNEFINLALDFEREHIPSMQLFVDWMQKDDVEIKRDLEQNDTDAVRLMTVHGSKGLQAPIVILPDTVRIKNVRQENKWLKGKDVLFYPLGKDYYSENCQSLLEEERKMMLEEYHRLLYVALTRAEDCLYVCGYKKKNRPNDECWYSVCKDAVAKIAIEKEGDLLCYNVEQLAEPLEVKKESSATLRVVEPYWLRTAPEEEDDLAKPLTPSHQDESKVAAMSPLMAEDNGKLYNRGKVIHKILQFLPNISKENRRKILVDFLNKQATDFDEKERKVIEKEVIALLENSEFEALFAQNSVAEVALMGRVGDKIISGQIDRLVVEGDKVLIVDYKTNRPAAKNINEVPVAYLKQMKAYEKLVKEIYPNKKVETYILWTNTTQMMKIG